MITTLGATVSRLIEFRHEWIKSRVLVRSCDEAAMMSASSSSSKDDEFRARACTYYIAHVAIMTSIWILWIIPMPYGYPRSYTRVGYLVAFLSLFISNLHARLEKDIVKVIAMAMNMNRVFIRFISHELRSHMGHLSMGLDQLLDEVPSHLQTAVSMIEELQDSCGSSVQILNDVVVFDGLGLSKKGNNQQSQERRVSALQTKNLICAGIQEMETLVS